MILPVILVGCHCGCRAVSENPFREIGDGTHTYALENE
jgi:hypothetical protein